MWTYLRLSERKVGLLINFNVKWLADEGIKRLVNGFLNETLLLRALGVLCVCSRGVSGRR